MLLETFVEASQILAGVSKEQWIMWLDVNSKIQTTIHNDMYMLNKRFLCYTLIVHNLYFYFIKLYDMKYTYMMYGMKMSNIVTACI